MHAKLTFLMRLGRGRMKKVSNIFGEYADEEAAWKDVIGAMNTMKVLPRIDDDGRVVGLIILKDVVGLTIEMKPGIIV